MTVRTNTVLAGLPVATIIIVILAIVGGLVVLIHPDTLSFGQYIKYLAPSAAILGIGRGIDATHKP